MGVVVDTSALVAAERLATPEGSTGVATWGRWIGRLAEEPAVLPAAVYAELMVSVLVGPSDEAHFRRVPDLDVRTLTGEE